MVSWLVLFILLMGNIGKSERLELSFPAPFTSHNRIMSFILAYNFGRMDPILLILNEFKSICEGGWDPTVVFFTSQELGPNMIKMFEQKMFCYRTQKVVPIRFSLHNSSLGIYLAEQHREYLAKEVHNFDLFMYQEEDMIFHFNHLAAFISETKTLFENKLDFEYNIGFQRYRRHSRPIDARRDTMTEEATLHQEYLEENPFFQPICLKGIPYFSVKNNPHQAMWILTQAQVLNLQQKCAFFNQTLRDHEMHRYTLEFMNSLSIFQNNIIKENCGIIKLIPAERLTTFAINHYYPSLDKYTISTTHPLYYTDLHLSSGLIQFEKPTTKAGYYYNLSCFTPIITKNYEQLQLLNITSNSNENVLIKHGGREVYLLENGYKRLIPSLQVFTSYGYDFDQVFTIQDPYIFHSLPDGPELEEKSHLANKRKK